MTFKLGDRVRSYDFPFDDECYIEGIIVAIEPWEHCEFCCGMDHLHIVVVHDTFPDDRGLVGQKVYPVSPESEARGFFPDGKASRVELV